MTSTNHVGELLQDQVHHKWITASDQHADEPGQTLLTRDRAVIRAWATARSAEPATGVGMVDINDGGAAIRFAFPGVGRLKPISWDEWFQNFDEYRLVFVFQEQTDEGLQSHKYRLVRTEHLRQLGAEAASSEREPGPTVPERRPPPAGTRPRTRAHRRTGWRRVLDLFAPASAKRSPSRRS